MFIIYTYNHMPLAKYIKYKIATGVFYLVIVKNIPISLIRFIILYYTPLHELTSRKEGRKVLWENTFAAL